jgi:hypothetical protein
VEIYDHGEVKFGAIAMEDAVTVNIVRMILVFGVAGAISAVLIVFFAPLDAAPCAGTAECPFLPHHPHTAN